MKTYSKLAGFTIALIILIFSSSILDAQPRWGQRERGYWGERPLRILLHERLNLTAEQEKALEQLRTEHQRMMIDKRAELQKIRLDLLTEMRKDPMDMNKIEQMIKKQEALRTEMQLARVAHHDKVRQVLTPEQREIWDKYRGRFGHFRGERFFGRGEFRGHRYRDRW